MKHLGELTRAELAAYIQSKLAKEGIDCVLTGGSCVSIYSDERYVSADLDFVLSSGFQEKGLIRAMEELGFTLNSGTFDHPDTKFYVDFLPPPPAIGGEALKDLEQIELKTGTLELLTPTDCVKDRLAQFYHWDDRESFENAVMVAKRHDVDLDEVKRWSIAEGKLKAFEEYVLRLESRFGA